MDRQRRAVGGALQEIGVLVGELAIAQGADVQDAGHLALGDQGDSQQRLQALVAQDRVVDVGVRDVGDVHRATLDGDATGEAAAQRNARDGLDLLLEALCGAGHEGPAVVVDQQDRRRVDLQDLRRAGQQLVEELLERQVRKGGIGYRLQVTELASGLLRGHSTGEPNPPRP